MYERSRVQLMSPFHAYVTTLGTLFTCNLVSVTSFKLVLTKTRKLTISYLRYHDLWTCQSAEVAMLASSMKLHLSLKSENINWLSRLKAAERRGLPDCFITIMTTVK